MGDRYSVPDMFTAFGIEDRNVFFGGCALVWHNVDVALHPKVFLLHLLSL